MGSPYASRFTAVNLRYALCSLRHAVIRWGDLNFEKNIKIEPEPVLQRTRCFC